MKGKLFLSLIVFSFVFGVAFFGFTSDATNLSFEQRFSRFDGKKDMGATGVYSFDKAHSFIGFRVRHMGLIEVPGFFRDFTGTVNYDMNDMKKSSVEFTAKVTSVDTGVAGRDKHLRTADFFEVEKYPDMTFKSAKIEKKGKQWMMTGDFTLKGVTKSITFPFEVVGFVSGDKGTRMGITAETVINRRDYGVNYDSNLPNGAPVVADEIKVSLQIEATMPAPQTTQPTK